jgi:hypothetical protein
VDNKPKQPMQKLSLRLKQSPQLALFKQPVKIIGIFAVHDNHVNAV